MDFRELIQATVDTGNPNWWFGLWGEESNYHTYKPFTNQTAVITYDTPTPVATAKYPDNNQVIVTTRPNLKVNPVSDADGDTVQYYFRVATKPDGESGAVINSGWIKSPIWSVPDGILQDGMTYYWHCYTKGVTQTNPNWVRSFKINLRKGRDNTQTYDSLGLVDVNLVNGNAILETSTHSMSALGGSIGLNLSYHTPDMAKQGLVAKYWNVAANYNFANAPSGSPNLIRRENDVNFDWSHESPGAGIKNDWYFKGQVTNITDSYDFDIRWQEGLTARNGANIVGNIGGGYCTLVLPYFCTPQDYSINIEGIFYGETYGTFD